MNIVNWLVRSAFWLMSLVCLYFSVLAGNGLLWSLATTMLWFVISVIYLAIMLPRKRE